LPPLLEDGEAEAEPDGLEVAPPADVEPADPVVVAAPPPELAETVELPAAVEVERKYELTQAA